MDTTKLSRGERIAGAAGLALLFIMFLLDWFSIVNAWQSLELARFVILLAALSGIALAVLSATQTQVNLPIALSAVTAGLAILAFILILYRIIDPPGGGSVETGLGEVDIEGASREVGVYLGLIAAGVLAYGGWTAMEEEGTSFSAEADKIGDSGSGN